MTKPVIAFVVALSLVPATGALADSGAELITATAAGSEVQFAVGPEHAGGTLTVSRPDGVVSRVTFAAGETPVFGLSASGNRLPDGVYSYEIVLSPMLGADQQARLLRAREKGQDPVDVPQGRVVSGTFAVVDGAARVRGDETEVRATVGTAAAPVLVPEDQVIPDDLIVQGSLCTGFDCVNNENFGFDTIRLKENNLRIKFEDTSASGFPSTDWQLTANDSASGGQNKFSIEDITGSKVPVTVVAGAATNSLFIDSTGRVGLRTSTPVLDLHIATSNTPAMRMEQNNSGGFTAQTWDVAGNEANFFIRDVTSGSRLPFRIRPGAPTSSVDIAASGNVGIGTQSPDRPLEITRSGAVEFGLENSAAPATKWFFQVDNDANRTLKISKEGTGGSEIIVNNRLDANGVTFKVDGSVQATNVIFSSSRAVKEQIVPVDPVDVLAKLAAIPISTWRYKTDNPDILHLGPMAEDFAASFGLGRDAQTISVTDINGVALAAIQGMHALLAAKDLELADLRARMEALEKHQAAKD